MKASVQRVIVALRQLKADNISVLLALLDMKLGSKERNQLFPKVLSAVDHVLEVSGDEVAYQLRDAPRS